MSKSLLIRVLALTMALSMVMAMTGCGNNTSIVTDPADPVETYTVKVANRAGTGMKKCLVEVFSDASRTNLLYKGVANNDGEITFYAPQSDNYVAAISKVPDGYHVEEQYQLTGERTDIVLLPGVMDEAFIESMIGSEDKVEKHLELGEAMPNFEVTLPDNSVISLSELLEEKKVVVLNFWFMNCAPCKMEFPYIQEGFEQLSDDIAVLALNPVDSTDAEVAQFQESNGYAFTMSKCDPRWQNLLKLQLFPTTLVIDRYGNICLIHTGGIENTQDFLDMVNYFIQDDYQQQFFKSAGQVPTVND